MEASSNRNPRLRRVLWNPCKEYTRTGCPDTPSEGIWATYPSRNSIRLQPIYTRLPCTFHPDVHIRNSDAGWERRRINLSGQTYPDHLIASTRMGEEPFCTSAVGSCNLCMPYWIRDQEGRLVRIENPQDTELDICVNIMDPPQEDQNSQHVQGDNPNAYLSMRDRMHPPRMSAPSCIVPPLEQLIIRPHIVPLLPNFHGMESENPYAHINEFDEDQWVEETNLNFSAQENEKFYECWERYMEAINACPHHGFDTWLLVSYFYDGMSSSMKQILETMCGGDFMSNNPEEAMDFLSYVSEVSRGWDEPKPREMGRMKALVNPKVECTC
ncbi:hypothetical protein CK203_054469 [Vitis vinifera]|uniref:Retrotransposon gag domain-containing protein n=1 Tax=Vitis vinifera TaxID=29760 RepID=A0A438GZW5_VITVI|nr:hypothetical protein CK203_054469 [Vitis vinifera]